MRILFVAPVGSAFGEALQAIRLATAVAARGHGIVFLAPSSLGPLIKPTGFLFGRLDRSLEHLDQALGSVIRRQKCDALVLVDVAAAGQVIRTYGLDASVLLRDDLPVVGLDCWNLPADPVPWQYEPRQVHIDARFHGFSRTVRAVPIAPPSVDRGFQALPEVATASAAQRQAVRQELGLLADDQLILMPTATWQHAESHEDVVLSRRAAVLPELVLPAFDSLGSRVHVLHVGPKAFASAERHSTRYHFLGQVVPHRFEALLAAADLLAGFNAAATSLATAVAAGVPTVLGSSNHRADSVGELEARLGCTYEQTLRELMEQVLPVVPVRAWPLSLDAVLSPNIQDNPFYSTMRVADPYDVEAYAGACRDLLEDPAAADDLRHLQEQLRWRIRALPEGADLLLGMLS